MLIDGGGGICGTYQDIEEYDPIMGAGLSLRNTPLLEPVSPVKKHQPTTPFSTAEPNNMQQYAKTQRILLEQGGVVQVMRHTKARTTPKKKRHSVKKHINKGIFNETSNPSIMSELQMCSLDLESEVSCSNLDVNDLPLHERQVHVESKERQNDDYIYEHSRKDKHRSNSNHKITTYDCVPGDCPQATGEQLQVSQLNKDDSHQSVSEIIVESSQPKHESSSLIQKTISAQSAPPEITLVAKTQGSDSTSTVKKYEHSQLHDIQLLLQEKSDDYQTIEPSAQHSNTILHDVPNLFEQHNQQSVQQSPQLEKQQSLECKYQLPVREEKRIGLGSSATSLQSISSYQRNQSESLISDHAHQEAIKGTSPAHLNGNSLQQETMNITDETQQSRLDTVIESTRPTFCSSNSRPASKPDSVNTATVDNSDTGLFASMMSTAESYVPAKFSAPTVIALEQYEVIEENAHFSGWVNLPSIDSQ